MARSRARRAPSPGSTSVDAVFQGYADRGVFRGYSAEDAPRGLRRYRFGWLTRRPMLVTWSPTRRVLTFVELFPAVDRTPGLAAALRREVAAHAGKTLPVHRRLEAKRATMKARVAAGDLSLCITLRTVDRGSATRAVLSVVNDLFLFLHEWYPEYLSAQFGTSDE